MYIKKIIFSILFLLGSFFLLKGISYAETFIEGDFIGNEYIGRTKNGKTIVSHIRFVEDEEGRKLYCIEPFVNFGEGQFYSAFDEYSYNYLSEEKMRKISLIAYFGYGYPGRNEDFWYAITQYLIWQVVDPEADIFFKNFTTGLREDNRYSHLIKFLLDDVNRFETNSPLMDIYPVTYGETLTLPLDNYYFDIVQIPYEYSFTDKLVIKDIREDGVIQYRQEVPEVHDAEITYYHSEESQDLVRIGNIKRPIKDVKFSVYKGDITLKIEDNKDAYSIESSFEEVCYEIYNEMGEYHSKICANEDLIYNTGDLPFGIYFVKQVSTGKGYEADDLIHSVEIYAGHNHPVLTLPNKLIKNDISLTKYYCKEEDCQLEEGVQFAIYDKKNQLVANIITDKEGNSTYKVGYGSYKVKQLTGIEGYDKVEDFSVKVVDSVSILHKNLYDQFIKLETPVEPEKPKGDPIEENPEEETTMPPISDETPKKDENLENDVPFDSFPNEEESDRESPPHTGVKSSIFSYVLSVSMGPIVYFLFKNKKGNS